MNKLWRVGVVLVLAAACIAQNKDVESRYAEQLVSTMKAHYRSPIPKVRSGTREMRQVICSAVKDQHGDATKLKGTSITSSANFEALVQERRFPAKEIRLAVWKDTLGNDWVGIADQIKTDPMEYTPLVDGCFWYHERCPHKQKIRDDCKSVK